MGSSFGKHAIVSLIVFIILETVALSILFSGTGGRQMFLDRIFTDMKGRIWGAVDSWTAYFNLRSENERLAKENFELSQRLREHDTEETFLPVVRKKFSYMPASIATMTTGSQHNYIVLDRGSSDGVEISDGVITEKGVIGIVQSVSSHFAYAISYNNAEMVISARIGHDGAVGTMRWDGHAVSSAILSDIPLHAPIEMGDTVYTSGFSPFFPGDIPLGRVRDKHVNGGSSCRADIDVFEDFASLRHVTVVKNQNREEIEALTVQHINER